MIGSEKRRDLLITLAWIGAVFVTGALIWFLTQPYRSRLLAEAVNKVLVQEGHRWRLGTSLGPEFPAALGTWFTVEGSGGKALVFTVLQSGIFTACVALTDNSGRVSSIVPLSRSAAQVMAELPLPVYQFYVNRIEGQAGIKSGAALGRSR
ncbi:MAG: hypothetical protein LBO65_09805 [Spirochaetaceae bacterium]|jgi:hypothetical protein|nr:hypothetical protein [Spirochaetaceae bacterium]